MDVAKGLKYLHSYEVVHGNLKGVRFFSYYPDPELNSILKADILIDENGAARLSDFGLASIANETLNDSTSEADSYLSTRWMAPELLDPETSGIEYNKSSKASDIYSFAMVVIEASRPGAWLMFQLVTLILGFHWQCSILWVSERRSDSSCSGRKTT